MGPLLPSPVFSKLPWESLKRGGLPREWGPSKFQWLSPCPPHTKGHKTR